MNKLRRSYLLVKELGPSQLLDFGIYKLQLRSGQLLKATPINGSKNITSGINLSKLHLFDVNSTISIEKNPLFLREADEIVNGFFHPFSGESAPLDFTLPVKALEHWTHYGDNFADQDIKTIWEPVRFNWVFPLCQAYLATHDEKYSQCFWENFDLFFKNNPINSGPNWTSAQEVALRLIPWLLAFQVFSSSSECTDARKERLAQAIWQHTLRIPPTLHYSHSQHNNHYLSEALGLMLGGYVFHSTSQGKAWLKQGFNAFQNGILSQVETDGTYSQNSTNYHRLMLHLSLLFIRLCYLTHLHPSRSVNQRLAQATRWLIAQFDQSSGRAPNLGHNDGSNLLPVGNADYLDYRPTLQAASRAFLGTPCFTAGPWDELSRWLGLIKNSEGLLDVSEIHSNAIHRVGDTETWGTIRTARFHSRPAHADLLHVDLWWHGQNIAADAGTFTYNLPAPWQNSLARTCVHNTITVANQDQMILAGKFLWLERAEAHAFPPKPNEETAILYCNLPIAYTQIRSLIIVPDTGFLIRDQVELVRSSSTPTPVTIQWLLPDWKWQWKEDLLVITNDGQEIQLKITAVEIKTGQAISLSSVSLIRLGMPILGNAENPIRGWISNTYNQKSAALSLAVTFETNKALEICSNWILNKK